MKKKGIALLLAATLCFGCAIGGTLAWLIDSTDKVTNTFTTSDVDIELAESADLDLKMVPGKTITKDPKVTVKAISEKCYVFVEIKKSDNYSTYLSDYEIAEGWTQVSETMDVYYRVVEDTEQDQSFEVLKNNQVTVSTSVTKQQMNAIDNSEELAPTLTFTAYAIQYDNLAVTEIADIWELASAQEETE